MTGTWITLPPDQEIRLNDDTRPFANEFRPTVTGRQPATDPLTREQVVGGETDASRPLKREDIASPPHGDKLR